MAQAFRDFKTARVQHGSREVNHRSGCLLNQNLCCFQVCPADVRVANCVEYQVVLRKGNGGVIKLGINKGKLKNIVIHQIAPVQIAVFNGRREQQQLNGLRIAEKRDVGNLGTVIIMPAKLMIGHFRVIAGFPKNQAQSLVGFDILGFQA